jgi:hypothetical protein
MVSNEPSDKAPMLSLREEAVLVITEWRDDVLAKHTVTPSEAHSAEIYLTNQVLALLAPTRSHYQQ